MTLRKGTKIAVRPELSNLASSAKEPFDQTTSGGKYRIKVPRFLASRVAFAQALRWEPIGFASSGSGSVRNSTDTRRDTACIAEELRIRSTSARRVMIK